MFKTNLKLILRNILRKKLYTGINIFGLAVGLALSLIVLGHLSHELSFEDCHQNKNNIYRVNGYHQTEKQTIYSARVMSPLAGAIKAEIPEVEKAVVFRVLGDVDLSLDGDKFVPPNAKVHHGYEYSGNLFAATSDIFDIFTLPLLAGDKKTVLDEPFSILITKDAADRYFPGENPIGKTVRLNNNTVCQIKGIMENIPNNTQIHCEFLLSYSTLDKIQVANKDKSSDQEMIKAYDNFGWDDFGSDYVYLLLRDEADITSITGKISAVFDKNMKYEAPEDYRFELQPLKDIYFNTYGSGRYNNLYPAGEASLIYTIAFIAVFVLLLAIANFINLSTARASERMREVGVRKVFGAYKSNLIKQFMGESFFLTAISIIIGLIVYEIFRIQTEQWFPRQFFANIYENKIFIGYIFVLLIGVGFATGYYPALYLSKFKPITVLQRRVGFSSSKSKLRRFLVIFQFTIAIFFICMTTITYKQITFIQEYDLGFDKENLLVINLESEGAIGKVDILKNEFKQKSNVISATAVDQAPGVRSYNSYGYYTDPSLEDSTRIIANNLFVDYDFFETFDFEFIAGKSFSDFNESELNNMIIVNKKMADSLMGPNPIGYTFYREQGNIEVVGVVEDFVSTSMDFAYNPLTTIRFNPEKYNKLILKIPTDDIQTTIAGLQKIWNDILPGEVFNYKFLDDAIDESYGDRDGTASLLLVISVLAIAIACMGMLGLVSFTAERKAKEIGIRKVLGASINNIVMLLAKEFIILIVIANIIAWPLSYLMMSEFLMDYAYQVEIGITTYIFTGLLAIMLAFATSSFQSIKAATNNPVDAIKYE